MKILVITDLYPIQQDEKFTPRTIYDFVQSWQALGHEVKVIKPNFMLNACIRQKPFYKSGIYENVENINYFFPFWGNIKDKIQTNFRPDAVIAHMPSGVLFAHKLGLPFVAGVHISDIEVLTNPVYSLYFKSALENAYKNARKIACRSDILRDKFLRLYPEFENKTFVAYSGIDERLIVEKHWMDNKRIVTCARLIKRKNIDSVIKACQNLNLELTIIGDGPERKKLEKLSENAKFLGHITHDSVLEIMRNSDIFILPSQNETFGMVYLEAMASGCVTIGLKNDGVDGIIRHGVNGYLTDIDNIQSLLAGIINKNQDNILKNAYQTIRRYTKQNAAQNYIKHL